jgi:hypothetical protein
MMTIRILEVIFPVALNELKHGLLFRKKNVNLPGNISGSDGSYYECVFCDVASVIL